MELLSLLIRQSTLTALTLNYIIFRNVETPNKYKEQNSKEQYFIKENRESFRFSNFEASCVFFAVAKTQ
jgi:hypothetical protein